MSPKGSYTEGGLGVSRPGKDCVTGKVRTGWTEAVGGRWAWFRRSRGGVCVWTGGGWGAGLEGAGGGDNDPLKDLLVGFLGTLESSRAESLWTSQ